VSVLAFSTSSSLYAAEGPEKVSKADAPSGKLWAVSTNLSSRYYIPTLIDRFFPAGYTFTMQILQLSIRTP
jgi:hypothetical protein